MTKTPDDLTKAQQALTISEEMALRRLAKELGVPYFHRWLAEMTSREYTGYRAQALVEAASDLVRSGKADEEDDDGVATWDRQFNQ